MINSLKGAFWKNLRRSRTYGISLLGRKKLRIGVLSSDPWQGNLHYGEAILLGDLRLDNRRFTSSDLLTAIEKPQSSYDPVAAYMQSFMFLYDLSAISGNAGRKRARQLIEQWIRSHHSWAHKSWNSFAWKPGLIGLRLSVWLSLYDFYASTADDDFKRLLVTSFDKQLRYLRRHWSEEKDDLHKFWALKGVILGEALRGNDSKNERLSYLVEAFIRLIQNQLLPDGGHISRSPLLHWRFLRDLIDVRTSLRSYTHIDIDNKLEVAEKSLQQYIQKMTPLLRLLRHGDGELATFDGKISLFVRGLCFGVTAEAVDSVLTLTDAETTRPPQRAPESGYERCTSRNSVVLINTYPGSNCNTSFFNSDDVSFEPSLEMLNIEWSFGRYRFIRKGDVVIKRASDSSHQQNSQEDWITNLNPEKLHLVIKRHNKEGHNYIVFDAEYVDKHISFQWQRHIYVSPKGAELRGQDTFRLSHDATIGIRFEVNPDFTMQGEGEKIYLTLQPDKKNRQGNKHDNVYERLHVTAQNKSKRSKNAEPEQWFFRSIGSDEVLTTLSNEENRTLLLMKQCEANRSYTFKWSFSQTSGVSDI
ncbi:MAG: heparinase II/III family protein [Pseudomonadota bacterium]